jgi:hypothetical protein
VDENDNVEKRNVGRWSLEWKKNEKEKRKRRKIRKKKERGRGKRKDQGELSAKRIK